MIGSLSKILLKVFVRGFYKTHAGLLVFLFVTLISYCFFIQVLNESHLTQEEAVRYNFIVVLSFISSPVIAIGVFFIWLIWTFKSWKYVAELLKEPQHQFLFYSATSYQRSRQLACWVLVQLLLSLPILIFAIFSLVAGIIVGAYGIPILVFIYVLIVSLISGIIYVRWANKPPKENSKSIFNILTVSWHKPFFALFLYHLIHRLKVPLIVTKALSYVVIVGGSFLISDHQNEGQFGGILVLGVVVSHAILIYQSYQFEYEFLRFARNFPHRRIKLFFSWVLNYLVLTLPENLWIAVTFSPWMSVLLLVFSVGTYMIFRSILYTAALEMKKYVYVVFFLFLLFYFTILFGYLPYLSVVSFLLSFVIFELDYFKQKTFYKSEDDLTGK